ncbi:MAG: copper homeostasis protein CutC, partial [Actinocatenispora sp.]
AGGRGPEPAGDRGAEGVRVELSYEVCVDGVAGAVAAEEAGADRVELCAALFEGGLTPSLGTVERVLARVSRLRVHPIVRPRGGDFVFDDDEVAVMARDVELFRAAGVPGVVVGALTPSGAVDTVTLDRLLAAAEGLSVTFHRAFDLAADPFAALEALVGAGVDRVLTSGQEPSALEGAPLIARLVAAAGDRITVMAGAGVNHRNLGRIVAQTGVSEVHFSAGEVVDSPMTYRNPRPYLGGRVGPAEYSRKVTTVDAVRRVLGSGAAATP